MNLLIFFAVPALRPLFISPNGHIFLETFGDRRLYHTAYDFLIAVAEVCVCVSECVCRTLVSLC